MAANPMKSTWRTWDRKEWKTSNKLLDRMGIHHQDLDRPVPVYQKTDKMPYISDFQSHKWILLHGCAPLVVHGLITYFTGYKFHPALAFVFYLLGFKVITSRTMRLIKEYGHRWGYFDGDKHERDGVPDNEVGNVLHSIWLTGLGRPMMAVFLAYNRNLAPWTISPWTIVEIGMYQVVLDFYFYWYHRIMHDTDSLWKFHRKHHTTKHPNPLLSLYADSVQEAGDVFGIPLMTYATLRLMGLPMGFYDWWLCQMYVVVTELWGHSGLRVYVTPATTATPLLRPLGWELTTEDHDLHHRKGWKKSHNYGKQTLMWDTIFGTVLPREETTKENVDWNMPLHAPMTLTGFQDPSDFGIEKKTN